MFGWNSVAATWLVHVYSFKLQSSEGYGRVWLRDLRVSHFQSITNLSDRLYLILAKSGCRAKATDPTALSHRSDHRRNLHREFSYPVFATSFYPFYRITTCDHVFYHWETSLSAISKVLKVRNLLAQKSRGG